MHLFGSSFKTLCRGAQLTQEKREGSGGNLLGNVTAVLLKALASWYAAILLKDDSREVSRKRGVLQIWLYVRRKSWYH